MSVKAIDLGQVHSRHPGDIANHVGQLHVHQMQGFLHMLNMRRSVTDQVIPSDGFIDVQTR